MSDLPIPYQFIGIPKTADGHPAAITATPVFHDGQPGAEETFSGELRCTLTALTPLLVANDQYEAEQVSEARPEHDEEHNEKIRLPAAWGIDVLVDKDKKILEPLRLPDGRVALPSSGLKGMLRQSLGALLAAPMERVEERHYSYRPNLEIVTQHPKREPRPAIVTDFTDGVLTVKVLPGARDVLFVRDNAYALLGRPAAGDPVQGPFADLEIQGQRLQRSHSSGKLLSLDHIYFAYAGGIDGAGKLAQAFDGKSRVYQHVLIKREHWEKANDYQVPAEVLEHYERTQKHLSDKQEGHLRNEHPLTGKLKEPGVKTVIDDIKRNKDAVYKPNYLIYVELEHDQAGDQGRIVSMGHHFRYRWRYVDTIRTQGARVRAIIQPLPQEKPVADAKGGHQPPPQLSGARLFFGYVVDKDTPGTAGIGKGDYTRLAGRLAFNMALEALPEGQDPSNESRFLNSSKACVTPLKILGAPRPSAVEHYLMQGRLQERQRQDNGKLVTYGDLPVEPTGELKGRKFYLHQPDAVSDAGCYQELDNDIVKSNQAALARFVSRPGAQFRFTLRFQDLRLWELGAVLLALEPEPLLEEALVLATPATRKRLEKIKNIMDSSEQPLLAHKLGHGRPLGLGSVRIRIDELCHWTNQLELAKDDLRTQAQTEFLKTKFQQISEDVRLLWLQMHQYRGRHRAAYPTKNGAIYHYHTEKRRDHAKGRRCWPNTEPVKGKFR